MMKDKVCIVTGGASGIGLAIARSFAGGGAKVVVADVNEAKLRTEADRMGAACLKADLSRRDDCKAVVEQWFIRQDEPAAAATAEAIRP